MLPEDSVVDHAPSTPSAGSRRRLLRGLGWSTLDQAISSCTNFGIAVVAARQLTREGFGAFGIAISLFIVVVGVSRALACEPLLSRPQLASGERQPTTFGAVTGAMVSLGAAAAVGVLVAGVLLGGDLGRALVTLAAVLPALCLQDALRFCFLSQDRGRTAATIDGVWLLAQVPAVIALASAGRWSAVSILLVWGGAGALAAAVGLVQAHVVPRPRAGWSWLRHERDLGVRYCLEFVVANGAGQLALLGLGATVGLAAVGAVRGVQTFFGPLGILFTGILLAVVPTATSLRNQPARLRRLVVLICAAICISAACWTLVGLALPESAGQGLFGETWPSTRKIIVPMGLTMIASGVAGGPFAGLRALAAAREGLRARLLTLPIIVAAPLAAATTSGAPGFCYGLAAATLAMAVIYWRQFTVASTRPHRP